jgi:dihydroorotate dehydrogenase (fumarate)
MDLTTTYLGLPLKNPIVASASPVSRKLDNVRRLEDAGAAAVVMYSLFEEQIAHETGELDRLLLLGHGPHAEAPSYFPDLDYGPRIPEAYLEHLRRVKEAVDIPVLGSLNGVSTGHWVEYAAGIEAAGADALELNIYYLATNPELTASDLERSFATLVADVRSLISIPLAVKLTPFFTALPSAARRFVDAGADGLVLFNRFYQPDLDIESLEVVPNLALSRSEDLRLPVRWTAILYGRIAADLAVSGGVHRAEDALKAVMAGASAVMVASELINGGIGQIAGLLEEISLWMEDHEYDSISQMRGSMSQRAVAEPAAFERASYVRVLNSLHPRGY